MSDRRDIVEIGGRCVSRPIGRAVPPGGPRQRFLSVWFRCCHAYGRMHRTRGGTAYEGRCPSCGARVRAAIGPDGTTRRVFQAR